MLASALPLPSSILQNSHRISSSFASPAWPRPSPAVSNLEARLSFHSPLANCRRGVSLRFRMHLHQTNQGPKPPISPSRFIMMPSNRQRKGLSNRKERKKKKKKPWPRKEIRPAALCSFLLKKSSASASPPPLSAPLAPGCPEIMGMAKLKRHSLGCNLSHIKCLIIVGKSRQTTNMAKESQPWNVVDRRPYAATSILLKVPPPRCPNLPLLGRRKVQIWLRCRGSHCSLQEKKRGEKGGKHVNKVFI